MAVCKDNIPLYNSVVTSLMQVVCAYKLHVLHSFFCYVDTHFVLVRY